MTDKTRAEILLEENEDFIRKYVNGFIARGKGSLSHIREDLFQEARLAFWSWAKRNIDEPDIDPADSAIYIKEAIYKEASRASGFHIAKNMLKNFYGEITVILFDASFMEACSESDETDYMLDFDLWKNTLTGIQRKIVEYKMRGYTLSEISKTLSVSIDSIHANLYGLIRNSYNKYFGIKDSTKKEGSHAA